MDVERDVSFDHLDFVFSKDSVALVQLLEARRVVEAGNARLAAVRITDGEVAELGDLVLSLTNGIDDPDRFSELDIAFHNAVCAAANNFLLRAHDPDAAERAMVDHLDHVEEGLRSAIDDDDTKPAVAAGRTR